MATRTGNTIWIAAMPTLILLLVVAIAMAGSTSVPHTFTPGTTADANQVNANFDALETAVNDNDARITDVEDQLGGSRIVWGTVNENMDILAGSGFTVTSGGLKVYVITFDDPFSGPFAITLTPFYPSIRSQQIEWYTDDLDSVQFTFLNTSGALATTRFSFVAIGPR